MTSSGCGVLRDRTAGAVTPPVTLPALKRRTYRKSPCHCHRLTQHVQGQRCVNKNTVHCWTDIMVTVRFGPTTCGLSGKQPHVWLGRSCRLGSSLLANGRAEGPFISSVTSTAEVYRTGILLQGKTHGRDVNVPFLFIAMLSTIFFLAFLALVIQLSLQSSQQLSRYLPFSISIFPCRHKTTEEMCIRITERYAICRCIYHVHSVDACPYFGRHPVEERVVYVGALCPTHSRKPRKTAFDDDSIRNDTGDPAPRPCSLGHDLAVYDKPRATSPEVSKTAPF
ncbi:hypothetical protein M8818_002512 [Zalaria obscura]|uniref:Uncharacterized protein n=1 Tax=Zalaria obscura TaxID=2024903 RepID=A0ACC3SJ73_9PEZI